MEEEDGAGRQDRMKDTADSTDLGVSQQRSAAGSRTRAWLHNEFVRVGLAETLCTYIMMVRDIPQQNKKNKNKPRGASGGSCSSTRAVF